MVISEEFLLVPLLVVILAELSLVCAVQRIPWKGIYSMQRITSITSSSY